MANEIPEDTHKEVASALARMTQSDGFSSSPRIVAFLNYIVAEALAGRAASIKAKTIAMDVYGRAPQDDQPINLVRVDAGRLRRLLNAYYAGDGLSETVEIRVPKGSYVPEFIMRDAGSADSGAPVPARPFRPVLFSVLAVCGLLALIWVIAGRNPPTSGAPASQIAERAATFEISPQRLQAEAMISDAKWLMFPAFDSARLAASKSLFERAVELNPMSGDALAGVGITTSMTAFLSPPSEQKLQMAAAGQEITRRAVELAPGSGWVRIASAWALFVNGDTKAARREAETGRRLAPMESTVQDFAALIGLFSGDFQEAIRLSDTAQDGLAYSNRSPRINILGVARFHLGDYPGAVQALQKSATEGAPVSALATAYLVAALQAQGDTAQARALAANLKKGWPKADVGALAKVLFSPDVDLRPLLDRLDQAGVKSLGN